MAFIEAHNEPQHNYDIARVRVRTLSSFTLGGVLQHPRDQVHPQGAVHAGRYGQQAGCTHPTGMHSSLALDLFLQKMHKKEIFKSANDVDLYPKVSDSVSSCRLRSACI